MVPLCSLRRRTLIRGFVLDSLSVVVLLWLWLLLLLLKLRKRTSSSPIIIETCSFTFHVFGRGVAMVFVGIGFYMHGKHKRLSGEEEHDCCQEESEASMRLLEEGDRDASCIGQRLSSSPE